MFLFLPLGLIAGGLARGVLAHAPLPDGAVLALSLLAMLAVGLSMGRYGVLYTTPSPWRRSSAPWSPTASSRDRSSRALGTTSGRCS